MSKYYDKELPVTVHVAYGCRHSGKTYSEFKKLKDENQMLRDAWYDIFKKWESQVNKVGKAIRYIEKCIDSEDEYEHFISTKETEELLKILRGE